LRITAFAGIGYFPTDFEVDSIGPPWQLAPTATSLDWLPPYLLFLFIAFTIFIFILLSILQQTS